MLSGAQFYDLLCAVVPLYVALLLGYGSLRWWGVVTPEQSAGLSRFNALVAMPPLVFEIIAFNDPYTMDHSLIAAYCLSNAVILVGLFAWAWGTKRGDGLDWVITLFQASAMPNTIIVGIPVLSPLYSITGSGIAAIFIGQVLWLYPVLFLYELRAVKKLAQAGVLPAQNGGAAAPGIGHPHGQNGVPGDSNDASERGERLWTILGAACTSSSKTSNFQALLPEAEHENCRVKIGEGTASNESNIENGSGRDLASESELAPATMKRKDMAIRVGKKMVCLPLTYSTLLGIVYSLIAGRWNFGPPRILRNSLDIIGRITLGLTMYTIGLFMAGQKKLIASWWVAFYGSFCRFVVAPGTMGLASYLLGLRGNTLRFAFLQAALPQAVISFVFARDYDLHADIFTTAVSLQTIIFMPIVLAYYTLLEL